jgi:ketosteroid isomerase-like protein
MPISEEDVEAIGKLYNALQARDVPALVKAFARASYHVPGHNTVSGTYRGSEEILGLFAHTDQETDGTITFELHDLVGGENHVCMLDRVTGRRKGRTIDQSRVVICHVENGITTDVWLVVEDEYDFDEFWS